MSNAPDPTYAAFAVLGYAAYRHYSRVYLGPGEEWPSLDLDRRERLGLACLVLASIGSAAWGLMA